MAEGIVAELPGPATRSVTTEGRGTRITLIAIALGFLALFLVLPLAAVFVEALRRGLGAYLRSFDDPDVWAAIWLTPVSDPEPAWFLTTTGNNRLVVVPSPSCPLWL